MKTIGNLIWLITAGWMLALLWCLAGIIFCLTIIGIPFGMQFFKIAKFSLWPVGKVIVFGGGGVSFLLNLVWILLFGWSIFTVALAWAIILSITIIGLPFGLQAFKLAKLGLMPFGSSIKK